MDNSRMSTADMLQYCNEALAWEDFGPIDIYFFESVKKILLGQCSALEAPEDTADDLMGIERPVRDVELEPEYGMYADIYYNEESDEDIPDYSRTPEEEAFSADMFSDGFFEEQNDTPELKHENAAEASADAKKKASDSNNTAQEEMTAGSFTVNI